jgi:hypothetical protein
VITVIALKNGSNSILGGGRQETKLPQMGRSGLQTVMELTRRYFWLWPFNPGILGTQLYMYMLALMVGALFFWNMEAQ